MKSRDYYLELLRDHVRNPKMIAHCLASEAVMRTLARRFGENEDAWGMAGLLHDIDVEKTGGDSLKHGPEGAAMLQHEALPTDVLDAIRMHNEKAVKEKRSTLFQHALAAGETITGLIFAVALVYPDKKISSVKTKSVTKRMKEKLFAASVNRDAILECEQIGIPLNEFAALALEALAPIEKELGF
ncbi:MAG: HDIG domain-containing metalloprotein [Bacteroidales bacterium]|jgi:putative nucleotidyltransferase with HDIG domain|nr:HDIG domain-containing protein [Bacteroidales bacterium]MDD2263549.1 HDIG domain-containing protein [Bacteroidales bacterium]MDD2830660.1 HDIG domain-containing protein [Bacteroidales bacterium]MDD3207859.1 HDIG domain-containing protein [Bacteroidales bacterium]MDD3696633.1 HDIG domain-containing protein [Bacteroidales bacterium]